MITWINILHFYQPPTISDEIIDEVVKSSYQSWVKFLHKYKNVKVTVNFTGCLTERLHMAGYEKLLKDFSKIAARGQIEWLESAAFHPILPLLPEKEIIKQIEINHHINCQRFGQVYQPQGFFLPEMAYSEKVAGIIKKMGYKYIILDEIALNGRLVTPTFPPAGPPAGEAGEAGEVGRSDIKYKIKNIRLNVIFRQRKISQSFVPETIINILESRQNINGVKSRVQKQNHLLSEQWRKLALKTGQAENTQYIITATDGELYGHRYWNWWSAYSYLIAPRGVSPREFTIKTLTASEYLKSIKSQKVVHPLASSWESTALELKKGIPYALWHHPKNKIHQLLWQLANFALKLNYSHPKNPNHFSSRLHLEKGLASCTFWWASGKDFKMFSPIAWGPQMVEIGAQELLNSIRALEKINSQSKLEAEKIFSQIRGLIWKKHWKKDGRKN